MNSRSGFGGVIASYRGIAPQIDDTAFIAENAVVVGDVVIGARSSLWYGCILRGDVNHIRIGNDTNLQDGTVVHVNSQKWPTIVGDRVTVGHMALLHACTLADDCMVGMRATVMDGAVVQSGALVAAGALVTPETVVPSGQVWAGAPAKYMRDFAADDQAMLDYIWPEYTDLGTEYRAAGVGLRAATGADDRDD